MLHTPEDNAVLLDDEGEGMRKRKPYVIHVCGTPNGPYRYGGFYFEIHPYCGPSELLPNGDPVNRPPSARFLKVWNVFSKLDEATRDTYAAP